MRFGPTLLLGCLILFGVRSAHALGEERQVVFSPEPSAFVVAQNGSAAPIWVDRQDLPGVARVAGDLQADVERVTGLKPELIDAAPASASDVVLIGTLGRSEPLERLVKAGKLDVSRIRGQWESFVTAVIENPFPGVRRALVVAGSDKRGAVYGVYRLSEQMGVSPWYWWGDVPVERRSAVFVKPGVWVQGPPSVKYRGIFLNDEFPNLTKWVSAKYGQVKPQENPPIPPGIANYGSEFYQRMFEVILRLKGNYLWPAMWNNAFNEDDPENARLADEYGVVMGTSHQEPMLRAQKEWDRRYQAQIGTWNYAKHPDLLETFWRDGIRRNKDFESIVTIGLRGANDTEMAPGGPSANMALLQHIVKRQRTILAEEIHPDVAKIPQLWCLYKEVQEYYEAGMSVPDDVTLLWAEDNWGNVRRLPTAAERQRSGGAGVYYHFDYHGGPRSYQWLNTTQLPKIWDQMSLAKDYGADRIWIVNVGHFKAYAFPTEYFLALAWDTTRWTHENLNEYTRLWAARDFGAEHADKIAEILATYSKYNARRKPELLSPTTYSLVHYREAERVVEDYEALAAKAEALLNVMPAAKRDAFYQQVYLPTKASAVVNALYLAAGRNALYARQGRASARDMATATKALFDEDMALMKHFNTEFAGGKWAHFMDQPHLGYTNWRDPEVNSLLHLTLVEPAVPDVPGWAISVPNTETVWPGAAETARLPRFDAFHQQRHYIDVFNKGRTSYEIAVTADAPWIVLSQTGGRIEQDQRLWVSVDWSKAPSGLSQGQVTITGGRQTVTVAVEAFNPVEVTRQTLHGFVEGEGYVSMEAEHFSRHLPVGESRWVRIEDYGHTLSAMRAVTPVDAPSARPGENAACLEYDFYLFSEGPLKVTTMVAPTLNFMGHRPLQCAVSIDDEPAQIVTLVPGNYNAGHHNLEWETAVANNYRLMLTSHPQKKAGYHTLKIWLIDPGVVVQKIMIDAGGLKPSYLGAPESYRGTAKH